MRRVFGEYEGVIRQVDRRYLLSVYSGFLAALEVGMGWVFRRGRGIDGSGSGCCW